MNPFWNALVWSWKKALPAVKSASKIARSLQSCKENVQLRMSWQVIKIEVLWTICYMFDSLPFFVLLSWLIYIYIYIYIGARSHENASYMRKENESQPHDWIRVTTPCHYSYVMFGGDRICHFMMLHLSKLLFLSLCHFFV